jgi:hypothetical protein
MRSTTASRGSNSPVGETRKWRAGSRLADAVSHVYEKECLAESTRGYQSSLGRGRPNDDEAQVDTAHGLTSVDCLYNPIDQSRWSVAQAIPTKDRLNLQIELMSMNRPSGELDDTKWWSTIRRRRVSVQLGPVGRNCCVYVIDGMSSTSSRVRGSRVLGKKRWIAYLLDQLHNIQAGICIHGMQKSVRRVRFCALRLHTNAEAEVFN